MIKKQIMKTMNPLLRAIINELEGDEIPHFFTGSRCWGVSGQDSDYDLCIHFDDYDDVKGIINKIMNDNAREEVEARYSKHNNIIEKYLEEGAISLKDTDYVHSPYGAGVKIEIAGDELNLIRLLEGDFLFWLFATNSMVNIYKINPSQLVNKTFRHSVFENLRAIAKSTITYEGWKITGDNLLKLVKELGE